MDNVFLSSPLAHPLFPCAASWKRDEHTHPLVSELPDDAGSSVLGTGMEHLRLLDLLYYFVHPGESPKACAQADTMSLSSDELQEHLRTCKQCQLRIEFLHSEMDWI